MSTVYSIKDRILGTPLERTIAEACNNEPWGASNNTLHEIAEKTFDKQNRDIIIKNIWDILKSSGNE